MRIDKDPHLSQLSAVVQYEQVKYSYNFLQKNSGWGGGCVYYTRPSFAVAIKYK